MKNTRPVQSNIGIFSMGSVIPAKYENSSQETTTATMKITMLLTNALGSIHGLPAQISERVFIEGFCIL
jgi:hypothetical protein